MFHAYFVFFCCLFIQCKRSGSITLVEEERANLSAIVYFQLCGFCSERFPLLLGAWDGLCYIIVALPEHSIYLFCCFIVFAFFI